MSFQFVNVSPDNPEHSAETRRRIRSQAMRHYRRRQRVAGEESLSSSPDPEASVTSSPQQSSASQPREESRGRKSGTLSLSAVELEPPSRQSSGTSKEEVPSLEGLQVAKGKRRAPAEAAKDKSAEGSRRRKRREEPRAQHGTFGTFTINLPKPSRPMSLAEDIDPLSSPGQLEQMLSICESYNRWLLPSNSDETTAAQVSGPWDNTTSQMLLFALCLKSIGHLDALHPSQSGGNKRLFKTRVLALANKRLKHPAKALEDKTIGALACLTSYEISRGSAEAMMHLRGLSQIIKLRGGTEKIGQQGGLSMFLEILDLIHAVYFHSSPMYTFRDQSQPSSAEDTPHLSTMDQASGPELDQAMLDEISDFILSIPEMADMDEEMPEQYQAQPTVTASGFEAEEQQWHQFLTQAAQSIAPSYEGALAYACGLAAGLHLVTTSAIVAHPMTLQAQSEELFKAMANLPDEAWDCFQMLHTRILLTALATARSIAQKSWYHAHLTRRLCHVERENWSCAKHLILRFIDMQAAARQPKTQAVRALVSGVEIVVDASEAREKGWPIQTSLVGPEPVEIEE